MKKKHKSPTKAELLQLQKLYKTDEKIGERLGGVPAYLVAYWRRKKNIPKYSLPKFSEQEIRNLWERFGDDEKAGLELGISKAAFYNWRRRYSLREKPAFLKLEQLELNFPGTHPGSHASSLYGGRTMSQKIISRAAGTEDVAVGETAEVEPDLVAMLGCTKSLIEQFRSHKAEYVWNPNKMVGTIGLRNDNENIASPSDIRTVREFIRRQSIKNVYEIRDGICQNVIVERGHVLPGQLIFGSGEQKATLGSLGALSVNVSEKQMATIWAHGKHILKVPPTIKVVVNGRRYRGIFAQDVMLSLINQIDDSAGEGRVIELAGSVLSQMTISERFTMSNLASETGAIAAICPYDATTRRYLTGRSTTRSAPVLPDKDAVYEQLYQINIDKVVPQLYAPPDAGSIKPVTDMEGAAVHQIIIGSCASGRFDELRIATEILKGKQVHPDCRLFVVPGSRQTYLEALKKGLIRVFVEAGAMVLNPSSCPCHDLATAKLAPGERCLATTNSHLMGHLGPDTADLLLCSPATAAASALHAEITDPTRFLK